MTDNFSQDPKQRAFSAEMPPELRANRKREPEIEAQIIECLQLSERELMMRLEVANFKAADYLKGETLVCLLSAAHKENLFQLIRSISTKLTKIAENIVRKLLRKRELSENFVEEAVSDVVFEMLTQVIGRKEASYDFWEVNFYVSLERLTRVFLRKHAADAKLTDTFSELSGAENEDEINFEDTLQNAEPLTIEEKLEIKEILGKMPDEHRRIFMLYHVEEWTQEQIAEVFGITSRTVRSRLKEIEKFLQQFRDSGGTK